MSTKDLIQETITSLSANKVRSGLTILGIVIGISSVIAMVSIGTGASNSISSSIASIGSNLILVMPGAERNFGAGVSVGRGTANSLTVDDGNAIATQIANIAGVAFNVTSRQQVTYKGQNTNTSIIGTNSAYQIVRNVQADQGSFIGDSHVASGSKVAVIGPTVLTDLFGVDATPETAIGQNIRIKSTEYKIIGVTVAKGGSGFSNADDTMYVPYSTAQRYLTGNQYLGEIDISAASAATASQVQTDVTTLLLDRHHIADATQADFSTLNQADIAATAASVTGTLTLLLGAIAGISLLVGGIGIMNMMLTNVTERTREIGLRKAIGAKKQDISRQFLAEAIALTLIGGVIGILLGWLIAYGVNSTGLVQTSVSWSSILLAFGVSAAIGIVFGWYPARQAANLNPIDALRYE
jgi:putative ABC transport system permease protein